MAMRNIDELRPATMRRSFVVSVDVDPVASFADLKFVSVNQDPRALVQAIVHDPGIVFFEGQEDLAARWMGMGNGALPLGLFADERVQVTPSPIDEVGQAREILNQLHDSGELDYLQNDAAYAGLRQVEALLLSAEAALGTFKRA